MTSSSARRASALAQGIETVRRDNCLLVKNVVTTSLERILIDKDVAGAVEYVKSTISDLLMNRMDLSLLVITKARAHAAPPADPLPACWSATMIACRCRLAPCLPTDHPTEPEGSSFEARAAHSLRPGPDPGRRGLQGQGGARGARREDAQTRPRHRAHGACRSAWEHCLPLVSPADDLWTAQGRGPGTGHGFASETFTAALGTAQVGDRVAYVIIKAAKGAKAWEKAEDPIWALEHNLPIDCQHYLDHHLSQPLLRIFEPCMKNAKELLTGALGACLGMDGQEAPSQTRRNGAVSQAPCNAQRIPLVVTGLTIDL